MSESSESQAPAGGATSPGRKIIRLTNLGRIAHLYTTMTPPDFWVKQVRDIKREQDADTDWEHMISERILGLQMLMEKIQEHGTSWLDLLPDAPEVSQ